MGMARSGAPLIGDPEIRESKIRAPDMPSAEGRELSEDTDLKQKMEGLKEELRQERESVLSLFDTTGGTKEERETVEKNAGKTVDETAKRTRKKANKGPKKH